MDPISIISGVSSLVGICSWAGKELCNLFGAYNSANSTLNAIARECRITSTALARTQSVLREQPQAFSRAGQNLELLQAFDTAVLGVRHVIRDLAQSLSKFDKTNPGFRQGTKFVLNEGELKDLLSELRAQRSLIDSVMNSIQIEALSILHAAVSGSRSPLQTEVNINIRTNSRQSSFQGLLAEQKKKVQRGRDFCTALVAQDPLAVWNLLESDADPESSFSVGQPPQDYRPLHYAIKTCNNTIAELLIAYNADVNRVDSEAPLHWAAGVQNETGLKMLLGNGADPSIQDPLMCTPLQTAAWVGGIRCAKLLIEHGAAITVQDKWGYYPLHRAAQRGHPELVNLLLDHGADVDSKSYSGTTPFQLAARGGCLRSMRLLIKRGADWNAQDKFGMKALAYAVGGPKEAERDQLMASAFLLGLSADINYAEVTGTTALHHAVCENKPETVRWLLGLGADYINTSAGCRVVFTDEKGKSLTGTPLQMAEELGYSDIVELIKTRMREEKPASIS